MAKLEWDKISDRTYESGLDHGVLYFPPDRTKPTNYDDGVAWNGLVNIEEHLDDGSNTPSYLDGIKYVDAYEYGDFSATLSAFTYPDEFLKYEGIDTTGSGLYVDDQQSRLFGMSYRTMIGSALEGVKAGYRIHLLYNLTVVESNYNYQNGSEPQPINFSWEIYGRPEKVDNFRPTSHVILDSRYLDPDLLSFIENIIYGGSGTSGVVIDGGSPASTGSGLVDGGPVLHSLEDDFPIIDGNEGVEDFRTNPRLPPLSELVEMVLLWAPRIISPQPTTGLATLSPGIGDLTSTKVDGIFAPLPGTRLIQLPKREGIYRLDVDL